MTGLLSWFRQAIAAAMLVEERRVIQGRLLVLVTVPAGRMAPERLCTVMVTPGVRVPFVHHSQKELADVDLLPTNARWEKPIPEQPQSRLVAILSVRNSATDVARARTIGHEG